MCKQIDEHLYADMKCTFLVEINNLLTDVYCGTKRMVEGFELIENAIDKVECFEDIIKRLAIRFELEDNPVNWVDQIMKQCQDSLEVMRRDINALIERNV